MLACQGANIKPWRVALLWLVPPPLEMWVGFLSHDIKTKSVNIHWPLCFWLPRSFLLKFMMVFSTLFFTEIAPPLSPSPASWWCVLRCNYVLVLDTFKATWILLLCSLRGHGHFWSHLCSCVCGLLPMQQGSLVLLCLHCLFDGHTSKLWNVDILFPSTLI